MIHCYLIYTYMIYVINMNPYCLGPRSFPNITCNSWLNLIGITREVKSLYTEYSKHQTTVIFL